MCDRCGGKGYIVFGDDTECRETCRCQCVDNAEPVLGKLVIHRDLPGEHERSDACWCCPHIFYEDDPRSTEEIIRYMEKVERKH